MWVLEILGKWLTIDFRIATQDSLLSMRKEHQRYVEIGPSNTLSTMMKKTVAQNGDANGDQELPECLTYADELEAIRKASEPDPEVEDEEIASDAPAEIAPAQTAPEPVPVAAPVVQAASVAEIEDAPPTAAEAVVTMVAAGLKIGRDGVDVTQSIKFLAKGESNISKYPFSPVNEQVPDSRPLLRKICPAK